MDPEKQDRIEEPKDYTRWIWTGIATAFVVMSVLLWWHGRPDPNVSQVRARHILITYSADDLADRQRALELAASLRERLLKGEDFAALAREYSDDPASATRGGDLGFQERRKFAKEFEEYVWTAPVGEISDVISTSFGFHIIRVDERFISKEDAYDLELEKKAKEALEEQRKKELQTPAATPAAPVAAPPAAAPAAPPAAPQTPEAQAAPNTPEAQAATQ